MKDPCHMASLRWAVAQFLFAALGMVLEFFESGSVELYDLATDIGERQNLVPDHPQRVASMRQALGDWRRLVGALMPSRRAAAP